MQHGVVSDSVAFSFACRVESNLVQLTDEWHAAMERSHANLEANRQCIAAARELLVATARLRRVAASPLGRHQSAPPEGLIGPMEALEQIVNAALPPSGIVILSQAWELPVDEVIADLETLSRWMDPLDEFLVSVCAAYEWDAGTGAIYLGALRSALLARRTPSPWDDL